MKNILWVRLVAAFALLGTLLGSAVPLSAAAGAWTARVEPALLDSAAAGSTDFIVFMKQQADLDGAARLRTKTEKGAFVYAQLTKTARQSQAALLADLKGRGLDYQPLWIANMVVVRGNLAAVKSLAQRTDVAYLYANPSVRLDQPDTQALPASVPTRAGKTAELDWNLEKVGASEVWAAGYTGQGVVIGGQDTGYAWEHPALKGHYRGWDGTTADHNYNWHDAVHEGTIAACPPNSQAPCDDGYHGTHTMGIMVGDDGAGMAIGMAPGARWIGCRNMSQGVGTPASYAECFQWFLAPTDLSGNNPRPDLAPDIINNSWSCPESEGCTDPEVLRTVVDNIRSAGILSIQSAGNDGPACSTVRDPAAIYDASFTVGNTDSNDGINSSSSRGPVSSDGSGRTKPDVSAPGTNIYSSVPPSGYRLLSGTSMAAPHVAGLAALILSARPELSGHPEEIEAVIRRTAVHLTAGQTCGDLAGTSIPNNVFGWGRIDAYAAVTDPSVLVPLDFHFYFPFTQK